MDITKIAVIGLLIFIIIIAIISINNERPKKTIKDEDMEPSTESPVCAEEYHDSAEGYSMV